VRLPGTRGSDADDEQAILTRKAKPGDDGAREARRKRVDATKILNRVRAIAETFAADRPARQQRRSLEPADFDALREAGFLLTGVPVELGGIWMHVPGSTRQVCEILRTLAHGDPSVALVCSMHPAVLAFWLATPDVPPEARTPWAAQRRSVFDAAAEGWWGTITSEPGSGGDVARTKAVAARDNGTYRLSGQKHFGSGSGVTSYMLTTAVPEGEQEPDWFFVDVRDVPWDGSKGMKLLAEWDGHGMAATQSHGMAFEGFPATRIAWPGNWRALADAAGPFVGCVFTAVVLGVLETAVATARASLLKDPGKLRPYEQVEWTRAESDAWLAVQAYEGMLTAVETKPAPQREVVMGKASVAALAESSLLRISRVLGGGTYSRRSPYGHWFEDVRALGFLRPPWGLAHDVLFSTASTETETGSFGASR
jgi:alkylation response protein AidB-like acyl-CoA dehydrogenase